jgi:hypothetical protein
MEYERLAFDAALRALDKQSRLSSIGTSVFILVPRGDQFTFSLSGPGVYEALYEIRDDLAEVHRRLAYDLLRFWETNDGHLKPLFRAYRAGALALVVQILALVALVSGSIF